MASSSLEISPGPARKMESGLGQTQSANVSFDIFHYHKQANNLHRLTFVVIVLCPDLTTPANGNVNQPGNTVETVATYTCNNGYVLVGDESRTCRENGKWTGEDPTCVRKY